MILHYLVIHKHFDTRANCAEITIKSDHIKLRCYALHVSSNTDSYLFEHNLLLV